MVEKQSVRGWIRPGWLLLLGAFLLTGCDPRAEEPGEASLEKVVFMADWLAVPEQGGFFQALAKGFYAEAGLDVEIIHRTGNTPQTMIVTKGGADISIGGSDEALLAIGQGMPLQILKPYFQNHPYCLMFHKGHKVERFEDLDGRQVMSFLGATWIPYVENKFDIQLNLIPLNDTIQHFIADTSGEFIQAVFVTNEPVVALNNGVETETLLIAESGWNPYKVMFSSRRFIQSNPEAVRAFVEASMRGWEDYMSGDPSPAHALIADRNPAMSLSFMESIREAMREYRIVSGDPAKGEDLGTVDPDRLLQEMADLKELGMVNSVYGIEQILANPSTGTASTVGQVE